MNSKAQEKNEVWEESRKNNKKADKKANHESWIHDCQ